MGSGGYRKNAWTSENQWGSQSGKGYGPKSSGKGKGVYTPVGKAAGKKGKDKTYIHAVSKEDAYIPSFSSMYPDAQFNCVKDFGQGPARLDPAHIAQHTNAKNSEFHRRPHMAISFAAASVLTLEKHAASIPEGLHTVVPDTDRTSIFRALLDLRRALSSDEGKAFLAAARYLNLGKDASGKKGAALRENLQIFLKTLAGDDHLARILKRLMISGSAYTVSSGWLLMSLACVSDLEQWSLGFPANPEIASRYNDPMKHWFRNPQSVKALTEGIARMVEQRGQEEAGRGQVGSWDDVDEDSMC